MITEHDRVVLTTDKADAGLEAGDVGTVVHVYSEEQAFEVEFVTLAGATVAVLSVRESEVRPVRSHELTHARTME